jgi:stage II sporulation protein Q
MKSYFKLVIPFLYVGIVVFMVLISTILISGVKNYIKEDAVYKYALKDVFEGDVFPVMKVETENIVRPYIDSNVTVGKYFYDYESSNDIQSNSIIYYKDTYMQNTGVNYVSDNSFDIVSVLNGEVIGIEDNEVYGKIVTIKHNDNLITTYSNIEDVSVEIGYNISQGEIIGSSFISEISENKNMLHFEVIYKGEYMDPENLYTLKVSDVE